MFGRKRTAHQLVKANERIAELESQLQKAEEELFSVKSQLAGREEISRNGAEQARQFANKINRNYQELLDDIVAVVNKSKTKTSLVGSIATNPKCMDNPLVQEMVKSDPSLLKLRSESDGQSQED